jgi:hypothetical protein
MGAVRTINYRQFYELLKQMYGADKADLVLQFTNGRTDSLTAMKPEEYFSMLGAMQARVKSDSAQHAALDKARKRLIACIGGYLTAMGSKNEIGLIKATACRASAYYTRFNDIPLDRLNSLYNAFLKRQRDIKAAQAIAHEVDLRDEFASSQGSVTPDMPLGLLKKKLNAAIACELYELAGRIQRRIDEIVNSK